MTQTELLLAIAALLISPGPTNSLLALAGAQSGWLAGVRLIPVELCAYLLVVVPLVFWGAPLIDKLPLLRPILTGVAALWVAWLAFRLWTVPRAHAGAVRVSLRQIGVTTLLNPKGLIFGLVLLPSAHDLPPALLGFALLVPAISALWLALGAGVLARSGAWLNRAAAMWLGALSLLLALKVLAA